MSALNQELLKKIYEVFLKKINDVSLLFSQHIFTFVRLYAYLEKD